MSAPNLGHTPGSHTGSDTGGVDGPVWLRRGLVAVLLLACAVTMSSNAADPDLWGHVRYGRDALRDGLPATTTYSFTAQGYRWINHENLSELALAVVADTLGGSGLLAMKCLLGLAVTGLVIQVCRRERVGTTALCATAILVAVNLMHGWSVRPQLFSYVLFALVMAIVTWCFAGFAGHWHLPVFRRPARAGDRFHMKSDEPGPDPQVVSMRRIGWLWTAVPIFFVWTNTHGAFVAGICIFMAVLAFRAVELLVVGGRRAVPTVLHLAAVTAAAGLVTLANPYGPGLHAWLLESLGRPRPEILEWHGLSWTSRQIWPFLLLVTVWAAALLRSRKPIDATHLAVMLLVAWQASMHQRHVPFLAILFGLWMPGHVESMFARSRTATSSHAFDSGMSRRRRLAFALGLSLATAVLGGRVCQRVGVMPVERAKYPVDAFAFMAQHNLHGRLVVTYNWAQYAIAAFGAPEPMPGKSLVGFDGRFRTCYPQSTVDAHFDFILGDGPGELRHRGPDSAPFDADRVLELGRPDLVLLDRGQPHSVAVMESRSREWTLLYQDNLAQLWGRTSAYGDPRNAQFIAPADRLISNRRPTGTVAWPALPAATGTTRLADGNPPQPSFSGTGT